MLKYTKTNMLLYLRENINKAKILDIYYFTVSDWINNNNFIINDLQNTFNSSVIIRSSSLLEDNEYQSNAGKYKSEINVDISSDIMIIKSINSVIDSYDKNENFLFNQILVQPMLENIKISGVALTFDFENNRPYYVINYTASTDLITDGRSNNYYTQYILHGTKSVEENNNVFQAVLEIEELLGIKSLDIEFACTIEDVFIFQVRKLIINNDNFNNSLFHDIAYTIRNTHDIFFLSIGLDKKLNHKTIYSNMADWNPAELIGKHPSNLDLTLYEYIFTSLSWTKGRHLLGYKDLSNLQLIKTFLGHPYINVYVDLYSYLPNELNDSICNKIINHHIETLIQNPYLHDKIEFNIIDTCFTINTPLSSYSFLSENEKIQYFNILKYLTNNIINDKFGTLIQTIDEFELLCYEFDSTVKIMQMSELEKTLMNIRNKFALFYCIIVRAAFIGYHQLIMIFNKFKFKNLTISSVLSKINSITIEQINDVSQLLNYKISKEEFINKYKHIKQNMFDITDVSKYEDEEYIHYLYNKHKIKNNIENVNIEDKEYEQINTFLLKQGLLFTFDKLISYTTMMFRYRELIKNEILKKINQIFECIKLYCASNKIEIELIRHININQLINKYQYPKLIKTIAEKNKQKYELEKLVNLPDVIINNDCFTNYISYVACPNFITNKIVKGEIIYLDKYIKYENCEGKIILIEHADPGYDWLFNCNIVALITCFGGVASHMSIRCHELNLPAIIGIGEVLFKLLNKSRFIEINCHNKKVKVNGNYIYQE